MLIKASNDFSPPIRKDSCRLSSCVNVCLHCVIANRHSVRSCRRSLTRPMISPYSCAWRKLSQHSLLACAARRKRLVSLNARKSCDCWLKTFWSARIPSPFVTAFRFLRVRPKTGDPTTQTVKITFCVSGVLSPLLRNLVLDDLDRELARRGHRYVRYADDCNIYVRSERAGQRVMKSITRFIMQKLKLKVNETKSAVARPQERKFLGFSFTDGPEVQRVIAPKALDRFKRRVREITRRAKGVSIEMTMAELAPYMRGWRTYFGFCETPQVLVQLTRWVRLRLRVALWRQWKTPRRRRAALLALGVRPRLAYNTASSHRGPRYLAQAKALSVGLSNAYFHSLGLPTLYEVC